MQLSLDEKQAALLRNILERYLGDFRMEIRDTENYAMRKDMQVDEVALKAILEQLSSAASRP